MTKPLSFDDLLSRLKSNWGAATGFAVLILSAPPIQLYKFVAPPFGPTHSATAWSVYLISIVVAIVFFRTVKLEPRKNMLAFGLVFAVSIVSCFALNFLLVRSIDTGDGKRVSVIIGFARTDWATEHYKDYSDEAILEEIGATEERIDKAWTPISVSLANLVYGASFLGTIVSLCAVLTLQTMTQKAGKRGLHLHDPNPKKKVS